MNFTLDDWGNVATIVAAIIAVFALLYTASQVRLSAKVSRAQFWLELRKMFSEHNEIHLKLRNEQWSNDDDNFPSEDDWSKLEAYMGLFEHCQTMLSERLLDWKTFSDIYGYRILNIVSNPIIVREKLINRRRGWERFIELTQRLDTKMPKARYLSGYWDRTLNQWVLWWGHVHKEEGCMRLNSEEEFASYYFKLVDQLQVTDGKLYRAWLRKDWATVHQWPPKSPKNDPHENSVPTIQTDA